MITGVVVLAGLALALAAILVCAERLLPDEGDELVARIEGCLPRIQCAQCGYPGCRPYARAVADGAAEINRCPPGGAQTIKALAALLGKEEVPLDATLGRASMDRVARVAEAACIGCNLCARACPVDAIVGVPHMMHTVIANECTGCELCIPSCPVDCIRLVPRGA